MILDTTTKTLELVLAGAVTTNQLPYSIGYVDVDQTTFAMSAVSSGDGVTNDTTPVTIVAAPASGKSRQVKFLSVYNKDVAAATVSLQIHDGADTRIILKIILSVGDNLSYVA